MEYKTILIDPPWMEQGGGKCKRGADRHYPLMRASDILFTIQNCELYKPAKDCHLYLWITNNFLLKGTWLIEMMGFRYITTITWAKKGKIGLGQYFRGKTEHMLFAVKGDGIGLRRQSKDKSLSTLVEAGRPKKNGRAIHSAKPEESYQLIEQASQPPYLELFARNQRIGWTCWGNKID